MGKIISFNKNNSNLKELSIYDEIIEKYDYSNSKLNLNTNTTPNIYSNNYTQHGRYSLNLNLHAEKANIDIKRNKSLNKTYDQIKRDLKIKKEKNFENEIFKFIFSSATNKLKYMNNQEQQSLAFSKGDFIYKKNLSIKEREITKYFK
jgi:hypothetical protein